MHCTHEQHSRLIHAHAHTHTRMHIVKLNTKLNTNVMRAFVYEVNGHGMRLIRCDVSTLDSGFGGQFVLGRGLSINLPLNSINLTILMSFGHFVLK